MVRVGESVLFLRCSKTASALKKTLRRIVLIVSLLGVMTTLAPTVAQANEELVWKKVKAIGGGDGQRCFYRKNADPSRNNVFWTSAGSEIAFVLSSFGIDLPASPNPFSGSLKFASSCNIEAEVKVPQGHFIATLTQTLSYGIVKDAGATGGITSGAFLFQNDIPLNQINLVAPPDQAINDPLFTKTNTQIFDNQTRRVQCGLTAGGPLTTVFKLQLLAAGARPLPLLNLIINVDSADVEYALEPSLQRCP